MFRKGDERLFVSIPIISQCPVMVSFPLLFHSVPHNIQVDVPAAVPVLRISGLPALKMPDLEYKNVPRSVKYAPMYRHLHLRSVRHLPSLPFPSNRVLLQNTFQSSVHDLLPSLFLKIFRSKTKRQQFLQRVYFIVLLGPCKYNLKISRTEFPHHLSADSTRTAKIRTLVFLCRFWVQNTSTNDCNRLKFPHTLTDRLVKCRTFGTVCCRIGSIFYIASLIHSSVLARRAAPT